MAGSFNELPALDKAGGKNTRSFLLIPDRDFEPFKSADTFTL